MVVFVLYHLDGDLPYGDPATDLVPDRAGEGEVVAAGEQGIKVTANRLHPVDDLGHGEVLCPGWVVVVAEAAGSDQRLVVGERAAGAIHIQPLDTKEMGEVGNQGPAAFGRKPSKLLFAQSAD
ncbi:MAG TPA: hypothetical protein VEZ14_02115 [Dehalococcoidia bacterium]|nr:hypothetical protein [Dehalococcoidia bacterium]